MNTKLLTETELEDVLGLPVQIDVDTIPLQVESYGATILTSLALTFGLGAASTSGESVSADKGAPVARSAATEIASADVRNQCVLFIVPIPVLVDA